jgi:predicted RNase H-like nuclease (RuvC/YqgF family)
MNVNPDFITNIIVGLVVGLTAVAIAIQKLSKGWKETNTEKSVITIMHGELERMAAQNTILAVELNKLQLEVIKLTKELHKLTIENQKLNDEICSLTSEVTKLQTTLRDKESHQGEYSDVGKT